MHNTSDDVIIWEKSQREHDFYLQKALQRVQEHGLTLHKEKCLFKLPKITYFGMLLSKDAISADETNIKAIKKLKKSGNIAELRCFLKLATCLGSFIANFADLVDPLQKLLKKGQNSEWAYQQNCAFKLLKERLEDAKTMTYWKLFRKTGLTVDSSPFALGTILEQELEQSGIYKVVAYASQSLTEAERCYLQREREALAVAWRCERFRLFLLGIKFELFTDHKELLQIYSRTSKSSARIERWVLRLQQIDIKD